MNAQDRQAREGLIERALDALSKVLLFVGGAALVVLMLHVCADVAGKYFFNQPLTGTLEIVSWYYMVACVFLPLAWVQIRRQHLTVEMFTMGLNRRQLAALDGVVSLLGLAYLVLLTWLVFWQAVAQTRANEFLSLTFYDMPAWPSRWVLPVSFGLFALVLVLQAWIDLRFAITGRGTPTLDRRDGDLMEGS
ncbi:MAG: TRAP transporter small permease [Vannielia sp.]|uniref:TRAP transporter small permease n=1 Tax=Vannielia sp. TaxID=2813045 RepID=UPI003B8C889C